MSCGVCSRSMVVICSRCTRHAVPKHETSKSPLHVCLFPQHPIRRLEFNLILKRCLSLLQANPPPVVVNADSVDTPPYVSTSSDSMRFRQVCACTLLVLRHLGRRLKAFLTNAKRRKITDHTDIRCQSLCER